MNDEIKTPDLQSAIDRLLAIGGTLTKLSAPDGADPLVLVPRGYEIKTLAQWCPPTRIMRNVSLLEAGSFIAYVNRFKTENTLLFANLTPTGAAFIAMLDYHGAAPDLKAAYCDHKAVYATLETPEWKIWMEANRMQMDQVAFATWLEDNLTLFVDPKGADLLELVQTLQGKSDVRFDSAVRLQSGGNKLHFDEDVILKGATTTKDGFVDLPQTLTAGIAPFQGGPKYAVKARLKYRIESRKLALWFETIAVHQIIRDSIMLVVKQIAEETKIVPLLGNP